MTRGVNIASVRGDFGALMRTYADLGVPGRLLEAVAVATKKIRDPLALFLPLLWLAAEEGEPALVDVSPPPSGLIDGVPLYALDKHTRLGRQAIGRFAKENAEIAQFLAEAWLRLRRRRGAAHGGLLRRRRADPADPAVAILGGTLSRSAWRRISIRSMSPRTSEPPWCGSSAHSSANLDAIRSRVLSRALRQDP